MKTTEIEIVESPLVSKPENEVQRKLRGILEYWGPNGERHLVGPGGRVGDCCCAQIAYTYANNMEFVYPNHPIFSLLSRASGDRSYHDVSASGFVQAKALVLRAIELAA